MSGPPNDVPAEELFVKLLERPRPNEVVDWVRNGANGKPLGQVRIQVLTAKEHVDARLVARKKLGARGIKTQEIGGDEALGQVLGDLVACELLAMACLSVKPIQGSDDSYSIVFTGGKYPDGATQIEQELSADELSVLFNYYLLIQEKYGPSERSIETKEELTAWIERLVEGASALPLARQNSYQRVELITSLAARCSSLSSILVSLWPSLPESSKSALETLGIGHGFATEPHSDGQTPGSSRAEMLPELDAEMAQILDEMNASTEPVTLEQAKELALRMQSLK